MMVEPVVNLNVVGRERIDADDRKRGDEPGERRDRQDQCWQQELLHSGTDRCAITARRNE
jgi:hypothetical protein